MVFIKRCLLLFCLSIGVMASTLPVECKSIKVKGDAIQLSAKKPMLIFMQNIAEADLWLTHPVADPGASAGWTSKIESGHWSAMLLTDRTFTLNCIESRPGHEQQVDCEGAVLACHWKKTKFPRQEKGTFWAAEDRKLNDLKAALIERGFTLH